MARATYVRIAKSKNETNAIKTAYVIASIVLGSMVICAALAGASTNPPITPAVEVKASVAPVEETVKAPVPACPMCPAIGSEAMDMTLAMKQHCRMMMNAEMCKDDAACLLAIRQELRLIPEQIQKLEQLVKQSRQEAVVLLTPEQKKTLVEVEGQPASLAAMHAKMHEKMMKMGDIAQKVTEENTKK